MNIFDQTTELSLLSEELEALEEEILNCTSPLTKKVYLVDGKVVLIDKESVYQRVEIHEIQGESI
jgi:hypothetical protein